MGEEQGQRLKWQKFNIHQAWLSKDTSLMRGEGLPWKRVHLKKDDCLHSVNESHSYYDNIQEAKICRTFCFHMVS